MRSSLYVLIVLVLTLTSGCKYFRPSVEKPESEKRIDQCLSLTVTDTGDRCEPEKIA